MCALDGVDSRHLFGTDGFWKHYTENGEEYVTLERDVNEFRGAHHVEGKPDEQAWLSALGLHLKQTAEKTMAGTQRSNISLFLSIVVPNECNDVVPNKILFGDSFSKPLSGSEISQACTNMYS